MCVWVWHFLWPGSQSLCKQKSATMFTMCSTKLGKSILFLSLSYFDQYSGINWFSIINFFAAILFLWTLYCLSAVCLSAFIRLSRVLRCWSGSKATLWRTCMYIQYAKFIKCTSLNQPKYNIVWFKYTTWIHCSNCYNYYNLNNSMLVSFRQHCGLLLLNLYFLWIISIHCEFNIISWELNMERLHYRWRNKFMLSLFCEP